MAGVYGRIAKISNAVGRSDYLTDDSRQEEIVLHKENMQYSWQEHSSFEKEHQKSALANNEALEVHIALPNSLSKDKEKLKEVCDDLAKDLVGGNKDYEYAVHWNHNRTNLHVHILFSERENLQGLEPKVYKRDIYYNYEEKKLSKQTDTKATIIHHKGDIQKDTDGNIKYQTDMFLRKDKKFVEKEWVHTKNKIIRDCLQHHGYDLEIRDERENNPYLAQKKLYKGASKDYLEKAKAWNTEVKHYNEGVNQHIAIEPIQLENYCSIKKEVLVNVKEANAEGKKISPRAIDLVHDMNEWIHQTLRQLKEYINRKAKEVETRQKWEEIKEQFGDFFKESKKNEKSIKNLNRQLDDLDVIDQNCSEIIESKKELIADIEQRNRQHNRKIERSKGYDIEL